MRLGRTARPREAPAGRDAQGQIEQTRPGSLDGAQPRLGPVGRAQSRLERRQHRQPRARPRPHEAGSAAGARPVSIGTLRSPGRVATPRAGLQTRPGMVQNARTTLPVAERYGRGESSGVSRSPKTYTRASALKPMPSRKRPFRLMTERFTPAPT